MAVSRLIDKQVVSPYHGGANKPTYAVVHSMETPIQNGRAYQSALFVITKKLSAHYFIDPGEIVSGLNEDIVGWGAGNINPLAIHFEFAGYAKFNSKDWTTSGKEGGLSMIERGARLMNEVLPRRKIPLKVLSDAEFRLDYYGPRKGGIVTHDQCSRIVGGSGHWDPGYSFPLEMLIEQDILDMDKSELEDIVKKQSYLGLFQDLGKNETAKDRKFKAPIEREIRRILKEELSKVK